MTALNNVSSLAYKIKTPAVKINTCAQLEALFLGRRLPNQAVSGRYKVDVKYLDDFCDFCHLDLYIPEGVSLKITGQPAPPKAKGAGNFMNNEHRLDIHVAEGGKFKAKGFSFFSVTNNGGSVKVGYLDKYIANGSAEHIAKAKIEKVYTASLNGVTKTDVKGRAHKVVAEGNASGTIKDAHIVEKPDSSKLKIKNVDKETNYTYLG